VRLLSADYFPHKSPLNLFVKVHRRTSGNLRGSSAHRAISNCSLRIEMKLAER
jgi:hypothetical protein